ncbi:MAG: M48 family metalloprotease [Candidatus Bathyarchaeia archaeon]|jgi:Zn-dependent protease with chaperone function
MKTDYANTVWFGIKKLGFTNRIRVCLTVALGVALFNAFNSPYIKLLSLIVFLIGAELFVYSYVPGYVNNLQMIFVKSSEQPLPRELKKLAADMGVKVKTMKVVPELFNAFVRGSSLYVGEKLLLKLNMEQITSVVAHEFGHIKGKHAVVILMYTLPISGYLALSWSNVPLIMLYVGTFAYLMIATIPIQWWAEFKADQYGAKYTNKDSMISALAALEVDIVKQNEPCESHPAISKRIKRIRESS